MELLRGSDAIADFMSTFVNQSLQEYTVGTLEYPDGLRTKPDLQNYVAFFINTRDKATSGKNEKTVNYYVSKAEQDKINALNNRGSRLTQANIQEGGQNLLDNAGAIAGLVSLGASIGSGSKIKDWKSTILTAAGAGFLAAGISEIVQELDFSIFKSGSTSRLKDVITLHVSEKPVVQYGVNYTNKDIGAIAGMLIQGSNKSLFDNMTSKDPQFRSRAFAEVAKIPALKSGGGIISDLLELSSRTKTNPFREVLFESVNYRTFQFNYRFLPKTPDETDKVKNIIATFKKHMHPELSSEKFFYIYPSEFDIKYYYKDRENNYLHKFARCALTDLVVDYGGDQFVTFPDGAPIEIGMSLKFQELEQMTSEGIQTNGY
jgi:hypothetical protein